MNLAQNLAQSILVSLACLGIGWLLFLGFLWLHRPSREMAAASLRLIPDLLRLVRGLLADPETPLGARAALVGLMVYLLSPIDLIPDFVPVLGSADDLIVSAVVLRWVGRRVGAERLRSKWAADPDGFETVERLLGIRP